MPCWPVSHHDGKFQVTDSDGILYPITMGRSPVETLNAGWYPVGLQTGLKPFHLLELRNDGADVRDAVWYLSEELDYVNNTPHRFTPEQAALVVSGLSPLLRDIYDQSLCAAQPGVADSSHDFDGINPLFVREIVGYVVETALSPPDMVAAERLDSISSHYMAGGVRLSASLLRHSLDVTAPEQLHERLSVASPFDASLLTAQEQFAPDDGVLSQVYRFHDPAGQLAFYLLFAHGGARALYIPIANTVFATGEGITGAQVMTALFSYYASHTDRVVPPAEAFEQPKAPEEEAGHTLPEPDHDPQPEEPEHLVALEPASETRIIEDAPSEPAGSNQIGPAQAEAARPAAEPANWWKRLFGLGHR